MKSYNLVVDYIESKRGSWSPVTCVTAFSKLITAVDCGFDPAVLYKKLISQKLSPYTIKTYFLLSAKMEKDVNKTSSIQQWVESNRLLFRHVYKTKQTVVKQEDLDQLLEKCLKENRKDFYNFLILTSRAGLRLSEAFRVKWEDISDDGWLEVRSGKGGKQRFVPFNLNWLNLDNREHGETILPFTLNVHYQLKKAGCFFGPHDLRSYYANRIVNNKELTIKDAKDMLGHNDIRTTERYLRSDKERQARVILGDF